MLAETTQDSQNAGNELDINSTYFYEIVARLARLGRASFLLSLINGFLAYYVLRSVIDAPVLNIWLISLVLVTAARALMISVFWRIGAADFKLKIWIAFYLILVYASAFCWGVFPLFDAFQQESWAEVFIVFLIAGMSAGGLVSLYPLMSAAIPYFVIILMPLVLTLGTGTREADFAMAIFGCLYLIFLLRSAYLLNYSAKKSIRLEIENEKLFDFLSTASRGEPVNGMADIRKD